MPSLKSKLSKYQSHFQERKIFSIAFVNRLMPAKLPNEKNVSRAKEQLPDLVLTLRHRRIAVEERIRQDKQNNYDLPEYQRNKQKSYKNANVQNQNVPFESTRSRRSRFTNSCLISSNVFMRFRLIQNEVYNIYHIFFKQAEAEVAALNRRIQLLEEDLTRAEERLKIATEKLEEASKAADESERVRKALENRFEIEDDRCTQLELKVRQMSSLLQETENKFEEVARKLAMVEADLERAEERAEAGENKIVELEEELRVVGNNLKSLEVSEEKALQREDSYEEHIRQLSQRLKEAETRAEFAERSVQKLQKEVDRLEDDAANHRARNHALQEAILEAAAQ
ncbi:Tropomyosin [Trichinella papuae]|uniref:Tropomyosin n=1 Tax=Trichinella papuae TaxID=268474 RepID=A0A0V1MKH0_9BILA|nr:Tropomyosin [Trichinella papuae]